MSPLQNSPPGFDDLPVNEQIEYVQALWDRIAAHAGSVPIPAWHVDELQSREASYRAAPEQATAWEEVCERIRRRRDNHS